MELSPAVVVICIVDGCGSDLGDCRKYYQRHKVCELHSKSPQVSINGQHLRFCQQCSRFHPLEEFDNGKRSCRKRLDGHNRRRRKPRPYLLSPHNGINMLQLTSPPVHPAISLTTPLWSGVVESPAWINHLDYAPSLLSSSVSPPQTIDTTPSHVLHPQSGPASVSTTESSLDPGQSSGGWENDCDVGWGGMTDTNTHHQASFDHENPERFPFDWH
uniref:squamosa promoter-binding-like protein 13A n=1 Tax=Erigeron canadensis TaxID=72917 RepID=UPI001CB901D2|nr:squamosa promoter-binding-like protein 13A [Erigeron canadensis]